MSALDALFGRLFSAGVELELRGGLNASTGLQATADPANNRNDLSVNFLRLLAIASVDLESSATTALTVDTWSEIAGTFELGVASDSLWTLAESGAGVVWGGTETVRVVVVAQVSIASGGAGDAIGLGVAVEGTIQGDYAYEPLSSGGEGHMAVFQFVSVAPGETVSLRVVNDDDGDDVDVAHLTAVFAAIGGSS